MSRVTRAPRERSGHDGIGRKPDNPTGCLKLLALPYAERNEARELGRVSARARPSTLDGTPTPVKGLRALADEALRRLGVQTAPTICKR
jgi:hypothetical protein